MTFDQFPLTQPTADGGRSLGCIQTVQRKVCRSISSSVLGCARAASCSCSWALPTTFNLLLFLTRHIAITNLADNQLHSFSCFALLFCYNTVILFVRLTLTFILRQPAPRGLAYSPDSPTGKIGRLPKSTFHSTLHIHKQDTLKSHPGRHSINLCDLKPFAT